MDERKRSKAVSNSLRFYKEKFQINLNQEWFHINQINEQIPKSKLMNIQIQILMQANIWSTIKWMIS